ncbi:MAG: 3-oxoacid CoA-transferase [Chloroflexota bacterium]|nr:MAG: 3-oxoacid CoA-transferase [Chloroflexota bacterium]HDD61222.1 3-oxoacid CoA-transferase [Chloroflexota bacterium]
MTESTYNPNELMICSASRLMEDNATVFIGTGIPMLAGALAQKMHAPNLICIFEFGGTGAILEELPLAVGERRTFHKALAASGILDIVETAQRGFVDYGFLGGAQIDPYGNLNSTVIGDHDHPKVRLPGSGGGNDVGSHCWRTITIMKHDKLRFVENVDFITTPGYLSGPGAREEAGLPPNTGPYRVVTTLGILGYDDKSKRMKLLAIQPGTSVDQVLENTGFELLVADEITENPPPSIEELRILREEVDKDRFYI